MRCTYDQFLELFYCTITVNDGEVTGKAYPRPKYEVNVPNGDYICFGRYKGGYCGGNCWDNTEPEYRSSDNKMSYDELDRVLEEHFSNLSFRQYNEIRKLFLQPFDEVQGEYYGNTSEYEYELLPLRKLFDLFCLIGLIKDEEQ